MLPRYPLGEHMSYCAGPIWIRGKQESAFALTWRQAACCRFRRCRLKPRSAACHSHHKEYDKLLHSSLSQARILTQNYEPPQAKLEGFSCMRPLLTKTGWLTSLTLMCTQDVSTCDTSIQVSEALSSNCLSFSLAGDNLAHNSHMSPWVEHM